MAPYIRMTCRNQDMFFLFFGSKSKCFSLFFGSKGVGILPFRSALSQGGWYGLLLQRCMDAHPQTKSYPDIVEVAFGSLGGNLVSILTYVEVYLVAVENLILEGDSLE